MAKSNNDNQTPKGRRAAAPSARRRGDKAPTVPDRAPDTGGVSDLAGMSLKDADFNPSPDEIARRAFDIYKKRGGTHGHDLEDWFEAEQQLRRQRAGR